MGPSPRDQGSSAKCDQAAGAVGCLEKAREGLRKGTEAWGNSLRKLLPRDEPLGVPREVLSALPSGDANLPEFRTSGAHLPWNRTLGEQSWALEILLREGLYPHAGPWGSNSLFITQLQRSNSPGRVQSLGGPDGVALGLGYPQQPVTERQPGIRKEHWPESDKLGSNPHAAFQGCKDCRKVPNLSGPQFPPV